MYIANQRGVVGLAEDASTRTSWQEVLGHILLPQLPPVFNRALYVRPFEHFIGLIFGK